MKGGYMSMHQDTQGDAELKAFGHNLKIWTKEARSDAALYVFINLFVYSLLIWLITVFIDNTALQIIIAIGIALAIVLYWLIFNFVSLLGIQEWFYTHQIVLYDKLIKIHEISVKHHASADSDRSNL
jgi:hypothetical protein